jgi:hypothetical protein
MGAIFSIFGANLLYERFFWVLLIAAGVTMTFLVSRRLMAFPLSLFPPLLYLVVPGPWHKSSIPILLLAATLVGFDYINHKGVSRAVYCGIIGGTAAYFRFDTAGFIVISFACVIFASNFLVRPIAEGAAKDWLKETFSMLAAVVAFFLPFAIFMVYLQFKNGFVTDMIRRILCEHGTMGLPFPPLEPSKFFVTLIPSFLMGCFMCRWL